MKNHLNPFSFNKLSLKPYLSSILVTLGCLSLELELNILHALFYLLGLSSKMVLVMGKQAKDVQTFTTWRQRRLSRFHKTDGSLDDFSDILEAIFSQLQEHGYMRILSQVQVSQAEDEDYIHAQL